MPESSPRLRMQVFLLTILLLLAMGIALPDALARKINAYEFFDRIVDVRALLVRNYVETPDEEQMIQGAIRGMIEQLDDPYTTYFTAEELASFEQHTTGSFSGIGAEIDQKDDYILIVTPLEDSPAYKAGLIAGDLILAVNGDSLQGVSTNEAVKRITGPPGTDVTLTIRHPDGKTEEVTITRARIEIETIKGFSRNNGSGWNYMLDDDSKVGYIRMTQFSQPTYEALIEAIEQLQAEGMKGLVLDLRYNPGGLLDSATKIADLFLDDGTIVSIKGRNRAEEVYEANEGSTLPDFPMVILVNEGSASASEILSGALKDHDRAIVLGSRTVGKGSVQQIVPLEGNNGGLKLTTSYYYLPSGVSIHRREGAERWGVDPTDGYYIALTRDEQVAMLDIRREGEIIRAAADDQQKEIDITPDWIREKLKDKQLAAALETLQAKLSSGEWKSVGAPSAAMQAQVSRREALESARQQMQERLAKVDEEIATLSARIAAGETEPVEPIDDNVVEMDPEDAPAEKLPDSEPQDVEPEVDVEVEPADETEVELEPVP